MTRSDAEEIARTFLARQPPPADEYRWVLSEPREYRDLWYFDFRFEHIGSLPPNEREQFGGAPGFIISKHGGEVRIVAWDELKPLRLTAANASAGELEC